MGEDVKKMKRDAVSILASAARLHDNVKQLEELETMEKIDLPGFNSELKEEILANIYATTNRMISKLEIFERNWWLDETPGKYDDEMEQKIQNVFNGGKNYGGKY